MTTSDNAHDENRLIENSSDFAATPDHFQRLWTPHRMVYITKNRDDASTESPHVQDEKNTPHDEKQCPFCVAPLRSDEESLIVARGEHCYAILNLFPYNTGHLLICPIKHHASIADTSEQEYEEFTLMTRKATVVIEKALGCTGINLGINQGAIGGAGVPDHLHQHVVPRWQGDSNFMPIIAQTKALPELLEDTRLKISTTWKEVSC